MKMQRRGALLSLCVLSLTALAATDVTETRTAAYGKGDLTVVAGKIELSAAGWWTISVQPPRNAAVIQFQLQPPKALVEAREGRRVVEMRKQEQINRGQQPLHTLSWFCQQYAKEHNGVGPGPDDMGQPVSAQQKQTCTECLNRNPFGADAARPATAPFYFLVPEADLKWVTTPPHQPPAKPAPMVFELHPFVDDGKHWVLFTDGGVRRLPIDAALLKTYDLTVTPVLSKAAEAEVAPAKDTATYTLYGLLRDPGTQQVTVQLRNSETDTKLAVDWKLAGAEVVSGAEGDRIVSEWLQARKGSWYWARAASDNAPVFRTWFAYGDGGGDAGMWGERAQRGRQTTNVFNVLGGRAAVQETLQMEALRPANTPKGPAGAAVPISGIPGVEVNTHPFAEMLGTQPGGKLPLADSVPADRCFVYVGKPAAILAFLDDGAGFLSRLGAAAGDSAIQYDLKTRYLGRLGMDEAWLRAFLASGLVSEIGLVLPDLFLIDGTDVTVLARVPQLKLIEPLLGKVGVTGLKPGEITLRPRPAGGDCFWTVADELLLASTSRAELERVLALRQNAGKDSLGQSAEFRYMLTQLPVNPQTRFYAYFSDPFIRRLVGPEVKIGQLRRLQARARLETVTAAALLYEFDGHRTPPTFEQLTRNGYLAAGFDTNGLKLNQDLTAESATYGTLRQLAPLTVVPVGAATPEEAAMYKQYVDNYSRYWRQYFDPIAMRLDDTADGGLELTTFILPLLDNSIYNGIKGIMAAKGEAPSLAVPSLEPRPVLTLSLNLNDKSWTELAKDFGHMNSRSGNFDFSILDLMGPALHFCIQDSDPVLAFGGGDLFGVVGGDMFTGRGGEMMMIPMVVSILTRPCVLLVEVKDADAARKWLRDHARQEMLPRRGGWDDMRVSMSQYPGRDAWLYAVDLFGMIKLRFGVEIQGRYLVITNLPWAQQVRVGAPANAALNGAVLQLHPEAVERELGALFVSAGDAERRASFSGMAQLLPLLWAEDVTLPAAAKRHAQLFGFTPVHPGQGQWLWSEGRVSSSVYGDPGHTLQPELKPGDRNFGVMREIRDLSLNVQFEDSGLRAACRWQVAPPPAPKTAVAPKTPLKAVRP